MSDSALKVGRMPRGLRALKGLRTDSLSTRLVWFAWWILIPCFTATAQTIELRDQGQLRTFEFASPLRAQAAGEPVYLYERGVRRTEYTQRLLTPRVLVTVEPGVDVEALARAADSSAGPELSYAPGQFIFHAQTARRSLELAELLRAAPGVLRADPILGRKLRKRHVPNDPLFTNQWHLLNTGQRGAGAGLDIQVTNVWERYRGAGVTVAVVDDGVQYTHPDLAAAFGPVRGTDPRAGDDDPRAEGLPGVNRFDEPLADSHGTAVSGLIGARGGNALGSIGVAFESTLMCVRLLGGFAGDDEEGEALSYNAQVVQVSNNSWGSEDDGETVGGAGDLALQAIRHGALTGRGGKGTIYVFAGGNGAELDDHANFDSYVNSIYTVAVGAINDRGRKATYSERGSCLIVSAPGGNDGFRFQGITTTDLRGSFGYNYPGAGSFALPELEDRDYTQLFSGTSAAAPIVSGVIALMLEANPELGWRDVQEILMRSATMTEPQDAEWMTNAAGLRCNPKFGGGLVSAEGAVTLAAHWTNLPTPTSATVALANINQAVDFEGNLSMVPLSMPANLRVEHVTLRVDAAVAARGGLEIWLESPSGTISPMAEPRVDWASDYDFTFMSVFNWGEPARGEWKIWMWDSGWFEPDPGYPTILRAATLTVHGTPILAGPRIASLGMAQGGVLIQVEGQGGQRYELQRSRDLRAWQPVTVIEADESLFEITDPELPTAAMFYRIVELPD